MDSADERARVLRMIQNGQLTAEEGAQVLEALSEESHMPEQRVAGRGRGPRQFRIRVTDLTTGRQKLDFTLPWSLIGVGTRLGARFAIDEVRLEDFGDAIQSGITGKIADVVDEQEQERVEIFVE
jgi:hypothetical protein